MIPAHNCFLFTAIVMKFYTNTSYESIMCPIYIGVKRSNVKVTMHGLLKLESGT